MRVRVTHDGGFDEFEIPGIDTGELKGAIKHCFGWYECEGCGGLTDKPIAVDRRCLCRPCAAEALSADRRERVSPDHPARKSLEGP